MDAKDQVKLKTDIVGLISERVKLTKAGKHYKGLCPFHTEKTPSFTVSPELQIFKCFGCGESGDVFSFLEKYEGMEFIEALRYLAARVGVELTTQYKRNTHKDELYQLNLTAAKFYHYILLNHPAGKSALEYVVKSRQISQEAIETFMIGFAPDNNSLSEYLIRKKGQNAEKLLKAGLVTRYNRLLDRFRGRVIFPLFDNRGNAVGLAGRVLPEIEKRSSRPLAKYINSPETDVYHKSSVLYGLNVTRSAIKQSKRAIIVEGELDMISAWIAGVKNVVAIKGSALTHEQITLLSRLTNELVIALDSDLAGDAAARRGIDIATQSGMSVKVSSNEPYKDPDEFAKADPKGFKQSIDKAVDVWDFMLRSIIKRYNPDTGEGKAKISREAIPILVSISDSIVQAHYAKKLADRLSVPTEAVMAQIQNKAPAGAEQQDQKQEGPKSASRRDLLERSLIALTISQDSSLLATDKYKNVITGNLGKRVIEELEKYLKEHSEFELKDFVVAIPQELSDSLKNDIMQNSFEDEQLSGREAQSVLSELEKIDLKQKISDLTAKISEYEKGGKKKELAQVQAQLAQLTHKKN